MARSGSHARWFDHVNGVHPSPAMRLWLTDRASLTIKLIERCQHFRVQRLRQQRARCLADESGVAHLTRGQTVHAREVLLRCDERPVVFAHTIMPLRASAADWPFFSSLGERSLGTTLFGDPQVRRGGLQFARLQPAHPLAQRALQALGIAPVRGPLYARRCLFRRKQGVLLVTEVFLPALAELETARPKPTLVPEGS